MRICISNTCQPATLSIDESIVKSAVQGVSLGVGVRVIAGERTGYAYSDDLSPEKIRKAARVAACIANGPSKVDKTGFVRSAAARSLSRRDGAERDQPGRARGTGEAGRPRGACRGSARVSSAGQLCRQPAPCAGRHQRRRAEHRSAAAGSPGRVGAGARRRRCCAARLFRAAAAAWAWTFSRPRRRRNISRAKRFGRPSCSWMPRRRRRAK